jgi:hypothetical protein
MAALRRRLFRSDVLDLGKEFIQTTNATRWLDEFAVLE